MMKYCVEGLLGRGSTSFWYPCTDLEDKDFALAQLRYRRKFYRTEYRLTAVWVEDHAPLKHDPCAAHKQKEIVQMTDNNFQTLPAKQVREAVIVALLSDERFKWRSTDRLAEAAGIGENELPRYAAAVCARQDHDRTGFWGLVARVGA